MVIFFINMDEVTSEELVELLKKRYDMCDEAATHMACAIFSLSYVVE